MPKRELADFEVHQQKAFAAIEARRVAEREIILAARVMEHLPAGPERVASFQPLMQAVRKYNQAELELKAAQDALDERARTRK